MQSDNRPTREWGRKQEDSEELTCWDKELESKEQTKKHMFEA